MERFTATGLQPVTKRGVCERGDPSWATTKPGSEPLLIYGTAHRRAIDHGAVQMIFCLSEQTGDGLPGTPVVFEARPDLDPVFSGELMNAVHRSVQKLCRLT